MAEHALEKGVSEALNLYLSDCEFQPDEKTIRAQIKLLRGRIKRLKSQLPKAEEALSKFVHDSYTGEAFLRDELKPSEDNLVTLQDHHPNGRSGGDSLRQKRLQVIVTWYVFESAHGLPSNLPTDIRRQQGFFRADFH